MQHVRLVPSRGPIDSPLIIVGEAPGTQEVKLGQPFVGPSGIVLDAALAQMEHPEPFITNVVPHLIKSQEKDQSLLSSLVTEHTPRLMEEILAHPRKVILALGNAALWALTGDHGLKITKCRGRLYKSEFAEMGIVAATHPAYLLRGNGSFRQFKSDVAYAISLANGGEPHEFVPPTWEYVDNSAKMRAFIELLREHGVNGGYCAGDLETGGFSHRQDKVLMGGFTIDGKHVYIIPGKKFEYAKQNIPDMFPELRPIWDTGVRFVWHNGKFDVKFLQHQYGQEEARVDEDTMLMSYALDETRGIHDLETVAGDWIGSPNWKNILDSHKRRNDSYDVIPEPVLTKYMAYDIANTFNLTKILRPLIKRDAKSELLYTRTLIPGSAYLAKIESAGMFVDTARVAENAEAYEADAAIYEAELQEIAKAAGIPETVQSTTRAGQKVKKLMAINVNSPIQLSEFLFGTLKIPSKEKSTNEKVLDSLPSHPAVIALRKYRKINKGLTTYVTPVSDHIQDDGRVHQSYLLHGTATGRLACKDPNLQNIPREPKLRGQFIPKEGYCLIEIDLNQAELRSLAALSNDEELCRIYVDPNSKGLHEEVRADLYGFPKDWSEEQLERFKAKWYTDTVERVLEEQKMRAKNVNFGIVYGITPYGLAEQIEDTPMEASRMLSAWGKKFPDAWGFIQKCRTAPLHGKNLVTVFGHKKRFGIVTPETAAAIQNEAANFPHQSTASTITLHGGMRVQTKLKREYDTDIVNTVHDSLLLECPLDRGVIDSVCQYTIAELEQVPVDWGITRIPFKAEAKAGIRWGNLTGLGTFYKNMNWT